MKDIDNSGWELYEAESAKYRAELVLWDKRAAVHRAAIREAVAVGREFDHLADELSYHNSRCPKNQPTPPEFSPGEAATALASGHTVVVVGCVRSVSAGGWRYIGKSKETGLLNSYRNDELWHQSRTEEA